MSPAKCLPQINLRQIICQHQPHHSDISYKTSYKTSYITSYTARISKSYRNQLPHKLSVIDNPNHLQSPHQLYVLDYPNHLQIRFQLICWMF
jgi:hypothetical protein